MKIALASDDAYPILKPLYRLLCQAGHTVDCFGAVGLEEKDSKLLQTPLTWPQAGLVVAEAVAKKDYEQGIVLCWSGTGVCLAANKVSGIRAALCTDAQTATAARVWNHANVLALSSRLLTEDLAGEILNAWFSAVDLFVGAKDIAYLEGYEGKVFNRHLAKPLSFDL